MWWEGGATARQGVVSPWTLLPWDASGNGIGSAPQRPPARTARTCAKHPIARHSLANSPFSPSKHCPSRSAASDTAQSARTARSVRPQHTTETGTQSASMLQVSARAGTARSASSASIAPYPHSATTPNACSAAAPDPIPQASPPPHPSGGCAKAHRAPRSQQRHRPPHHPKTPGEREGVRPPRPQGRSARRGLPLLAWSIPTTQKIPRIPKVPKIPNIATSQHPKACDPKPRHARTGMEACPYPQRRWPRRPRPNARVVKHAPSQSPPRRDPPTHTASQSNLATSNHQNKKIPP